MSRSVTSLGTEVELFADEHTGWLVYKEDALIAPPAMIAANSAASAAD